MEIEETKIVSSPTERKVKKPPFKKLDMNILLDMSCWTPENFDEYHKYLSEVASIPKEVEDIPPYPGKRRYTITLHCAVLTIVAKRHPNNNGYQIFSWIMQDH